MNASYSKIENKEMISDEMRREEEVLTLQSVCSSGEFVWKKVPESKGRITCLLTLEPGQFKGKLQACVVNRDQMYKIHGLKYLPPLRLYLNLHEKYPSKAKPEFSLAINWLPPWQVSLICQKLDELWDINNFSEILFTWFNFLKLEILDYLGIQEYLDVSFLHSLYKEPDNGYLAFCLSKSLMDPRVVNGALHINPVEILIDHNNLRETMDSKKSLYECSICLEMILGESCSKIESCEHIFCLICLKSYIYTKIEGGYVDSFTCPNYECYELIELDVVKELCSDNIFSRYQQIIQEKESLRRTIFCPRKVCHAKIIRSNDDSLTMCNKCNFNFCAFCLKVYHGIAPCKLDDEEKLMIFKTYDSADASKKRELERIYGRRLIQELVEKQLTRDYLKSSTRNCPSCKTATAKISGCNLLSCSICKNNFCWLCGQETLGLQDPYDHFKTENRNQCSGRLFDQEISLNVRI